jgi:hypothetical protein
MILEMRMHIRLFSTEGGSSQRPNDSGETSAGLKKRRQINPPTALIECSGYLK